MSENATGKQLDLKAVEAVLRQEPSMLALDVMAFLERRGHELRRKGLVSDFVEEVLQSRRLPEGGTSRAGKPRNGLTQLRHSLRTAGLGPPRRFGLALRLLAAGIRLYSPARPTVATVADSLAFSSPFSLSNEMVRYLGKRPSEVRELYPWEWMLDGALPEPPGQPEGRG